MKTLISLNKDNNWLPGELVIDEAVETISIDVAHSLINNISMDVSDWKFNPYTGQEIIRHPHGWSFGIKLYVSSRYETCIHFIKSAEFINDDAKYLTIEEAEDNYIFKEFIDEIIIGEIDYGNLEIFPVVTFGVRGNKSEYEEEYDMPFYDNKLNSDMADKFIENYVFELVDVKILESKPNE